MTRKIFRSILLVAAVTLLASLIVILGIMFEYAEGLQEKQLKAELALAARAVEQSGAGYLAGLSAGDDRLTWVAADGRVLADTSVDAAGMENHADREEIRQALETGDGESARYYSTLTEKTLYYATALSDGSVLRISTSQATALTVVLGMVQPIAVVALAAIILSAVFARRMAGRIVDPLNRIDLEHPLDNDAYEELSPLLNRINRQHLQIDEQLRTLEQKTDAFEQTTAGMKEGLVLLDDKGMVLSINPAAQRLFGTDGSCVGQDFLEVDRSHDMSVALRRAMAEGHSEFRAQQSGREYQFDISRMESGGSIVGEVLLAFDVTEQASLERSRREFTANVSHELKTPLQSIIGSAELIENGLVKPEDQPRFIGHIHQEATRLVALIEDIIRLSQLDEGLQAALEPVDLYAVAEEAVSALQEAAKNRGVRLSVSGKHAHISGVRRLIYEIVYNLCDNAIKYNISDGSVQIVITDDGRHAGIRVQDTGIGIPAEHQSRVFERFYRVDRSHSRQSGGTGLGLSIVKHAAMYHGATIDLKSEPGKGTAISVTFPSESGADETPA